MDESSCIACETDASNYEDPFVVEAADSEIKIVMFLVVADELIKLTKNDRDLLM